MIDRERPDPARPDPARPDPDGEGITRPLSEHVHLLGDSLGRAIRETAGDELFELVEELRRLCRRAAREGRPEPRAEAEARIAELDLDRIVWLLRAYTTYFHLVNQAEKQEILRINRERTRTGGGDRPESIGRAIRRLRERGHTLDEVLARLGRLDIQPTLTAHPTEARRRTILYAQRRISELLARLRRGDPTTDEEQDAREEIHRQVLLLLATDEVRPERPTVRDEVRQGLYFVRGPIWEVAPRIYRDLDRALRRHYGASPELPTLLRFRSWIGSDLDGNPNVTPEVIRWTLDAQRRTAVELHLRELRELRRELSLSDRHVSVPQELRDSLESDAREAPLDPERTRAFAREPYRLKLTYMIGRLERLRDGEDGNGYGADRYVADLELIARSLERTGFEAIRRLGRLDRVRALARTFGFHLLTLDVRQHSEVHERAVAELLRVAGVDADYGARPEDRRLERLEAALRDPRPLAPPDGELAADARRAIETFAVVARAVARDPRSVGACIVSMTHTVSDLLEPMLLAKEAGLWRLEEDGRVRCPIDFVPLFETIDDLEAAGDRLDAILSHPLYRAHLAGRADFQEIMLGYSDSNKDGGYWMANRALHRAQASIGRVCREHGVDFRIFHGRGGTVGRGGGGAHEAILAMPPVVQNGRIRFTEQGEVISFRYGLPDMAHRHLEQIVNAMILAISGGEAEGPAAAGPGAEGERIMETLAAEAMAAYRDLVDRPGFWDWYARATPIEQISHLPIASRPVSRGAGRVDFEGLRAIPWVFAWTQTRYNVPGWFGLGRAAARALADAETANALSRLYRDWPFFRAVVDNAQREMARARLEIARCYSRLAGRRGAGFDRMIAEDFERAREAILRITGQAELLDVNPVIRKSIALRNPYTDVLNLLQIELLRRYRSAESADRDRLREALFLSINGIAAAMQSTG